MPVIVDAASEYDLKGLLAAGADMVIYSGHKFLGGPTSGVVAGRKGLVRCAYLQNRGIGRGMKVGKESIVGVIAALEAWESRDHAGIRRRERAALDLWLEALCPIAGIAAAVIPDPTDNLLDRRGHGPSGKRLHRREPRSGHFFLDPCNLHPDEAEIVAQRLVETLRSSNAARFVEGGSQGMVSLLNWPD